MGSQKTIGENIKKARIKNNLTQEEVAQKVKMNTNYYARIERGEVRASFDTLEKIFKVLKVKSSDIFPF